MTRALCVVMYDTAPSMIEKKGTCENATHDVIAERRRGNKNITAHCRLHHHRRQGDAYSLSVGNPSGLL